MTESADRPHTRRIRSEVKWLFAISVPARAVERTSQRRSQGTTGCAAARVRGPARPAPKYASNWSHTYRLGVWMYATCRAPFAGLQPFATAWLVETTRS